jgi:DNA-binding transcriptional MerR regulator
MIAEEEIQPELASRVVRWLETHPVPVAPSPAAHRWRAAARKLGMEAVPVLLRTLQTGAEAQRYSALMALRELGFDASAEGFGEELSYRVRPPGGGREFAIQPVQIFRQDEAARIIGISEDQLDRWASTDLVRPSAMDPAGQPIGYAFEDLVAGRVVSALMDTGISLRRIRSVVKHLRRAAGGHPLLAEKAFVLFPSEVKFAGSERKLKEILQSGEGMTVVPLEQVRIGLRERARTVTDLHG